MKKIIEIEGKEIPFVSNGATLRIYRNEFKRDMLHDLVKLQKYKTEEELVENFDYSIIENLAYICAKTADSNIPDTIEEWLGQFNDLMSLYSKMNDIISILNSSQVAIVKSKKKIVKKAKK